MGSAAPLAIGTKGTVGSLVKKEIEYFKRLDLDHTSKRHQEAGIPRLFTTKPASHSKTTTGASSCSSSSSSSNTTNGGNTSLGNLLMMSWRKKKRRSNNNNGGSFLPSMCSAVEVAEGNRFDGIPGFSYRSLKADMEKL